MAEVLVHDDADTEHSGVFFEIPQDLVDKVYSYDPDGTFAAIMRERLELADRYDDLNR